MIDWDAYRAAYPTMSYADVAAFHQRVWAAFPDQEYHSAPLLRRFFHGLSGRVVEVGGWRGEAANAILRDFPAITSWTNYEICEQAVASSIPTDPRYRGVFPDRWPWELPTQRAEIAVLAHVIEHINAMQLKRLIGWLRACGVRHVYVESPLRDKRRSWRHSTSAHLLEIGWTEVIRLFNRAGYAMCERFSEPPERDVLYFAVPT